MFRSFDISPLFFCFLRGGWVNYNDNYRFISSHMFVSRIPGAHSPFKKVSSRISCRHMRRGRSVNSQAWDIVWYCWNIHGKHGRNPRKTHTHNQHGKDPWFDDGTWWNTIENPIKHLKILLPIGPFDSSSGTCSGILVDLPGVKAQIQI